MRAVAILVVVLYHAHVACLRGGFTGVDDFYVISGFLITGLLWRQLEREGRLSLRSFYGRRIRRLLPMSFVVLVATAFASYSLLPPLQDHVVLKDGISSALYVSNYRFAALQTSYLTSNALPSPFQQYWSLSLEEQFYLIWPALLLAGSMLWLRWRRRPSPSRVGALTVVGALGVASFALGVWLTRVSQPWAFFSLPSRAWELAAGAVIALAAPWISGLSERQAAVLGWAGLATAVGSALILSGSVPYPGVAALAPVLGTAAVIASGCAAPRNGPILVLGRIGAAGHRSGVVLVVPVALARADPGAGAVRPPPFARRQSGPGRGQPRGSSHLVRGRGEPLAQMDVAARRAPTRPPSRWCPDSNGGGAVSGVDRGPAVPQGSRRRPGGQTLCRSGREHVSRCSRRHRPQTSTPTAPRSTSATVQVQRAVADSLPVNDVPVNLTPSLPAANGDEPPVFVDGCLDSYLPTAVGACDFGDTSSHTSIVLFGDSHAAMWFPAVDSAANKLGLNLYTWTKATCPPLILPIFSPVLGRNYSECDEWRQNVLARIAQVNPALVILGVARHYSDIYGFTPYGSQWLGGLSSMITDIRRLGPKVLVMGPIPKPPFSAPGCLSVHLTSATACTVALSHGLNVPGKLSEERVVAAAGGSYLDADPWFCTSTTCAVMVDNLLVYRDDNHITATYASYLGPALIDELGLVLDNASPIPALTPTSARPAP